MSRSLFITGAGSGLGAALARETGRHGWRVGLCGRTESKLVEVANEIAAAGGHPEIYTTDVVDHATLDTAIAAFRPDALVCCAAMLDQASLADLTPERFAATMATNVQGTFNACRAAITLWQEAGVVGDVVTIASLGGLRGQQRFPGFAAYAASKHAVVGLTETLALEGKQIGVRVNAIAPGAFDTPMSRALGLIPTTSAAEIVPTILYLLDRSKSGALSGATIEIQCNDD